MCVDVCVRVCVCFCPWFLLHRSVDFRNDGCFRVWSLSSFFEFTVVDFSFFSNPYTVGSLESLIAVLSFMNEKLSTLSKVKFQPDSLDIQTVKTFLDRFNFEPKSVTDKNTTPAQDRTQGSSPHALFALAPLFCFLVNVRLFIYTVCIYICMCVCV